MQKRLSLGVVLSSIKRGYASFGEGSMCPNLLVARPRRSSLSDVLSPAVVRRCDAAIAARNALSC